MLLTDPKLFEGHPQILSILMERIRSFDGDASKHCLNQRAQNPNLQSATKVKERLTVLKKQNKLEGIDISIQLWIYPDNKMSGAKKVCCHPGAFVSNFVCSLNMHTSCSRPNFRHFLLILMAV